MVLDVVVLQGTGFRGGRFLRASGSRGHRIRGPSMREVGPSMRFFGSEDGHDGGVVGDVEGSLLAPNQGLGDMYIIMFYYSV